MSAKASTAVGIVVAVLIIGAVASIGYYQVEVAPRGVSSSTSSTSSVSTVDCSTTPAACVNVTIVSGASTTPPGYSSGSTALYGYDPLTITVVIGKNNTVVWTNNDTAFHSATELSGPATFDSGCLNGIAAPCPSGSGSGSGTYQFTFTVAGTYTYHCIYHPWMMGKVIVVAGPNSTSGSTSSSATASSST